LIYPTGKFRITKTTIDIIEAVKHNKAYISEVFKAELWKEGVQSSKKEQKNCFK
jgi:hypothetical protein